MTYPGGKAAMTETRGKTIRNFVLDLAVSLDADVREHFGRLEQMALIWSLNRCGMHDYPAVTGEETGERVDGRCLCEVCGNEFSVHPDDWRILGYNHVPDLVVLCDGKRVKL